MKKFLFLISAFLLISFAVHAQLKVNSDGSVQAGYNSSSYVRMGVGTTVNIGASLEITKEE